MPKSGPLVYLLIQHTLMKVSRLVYYALWIAYVFSLGVLYGGGIYFTHLLHS
jgi:hypothetical protein